MGTAQHEEDVEKGVASLNKEISWSGWKGALRSANLVFLLSAGNPPPTACLPGDLPLPKVPRPTLHQNSRSCPLQRDPLASP